MNLECHCGSHSLLPLGARKVPKQTKESDNGQDSFALSLSLSFWLPDEILKRSLYMSIIWVTHLPSPLSASLRCTVQLVRPSQLDTERSPFFSSLTLSSRAALPQVLVSVGLLSRSNRVRTQNGSGGKPTPHLSHRAPAAVS